MSNTFMWMDWLGAQPTACRRVVVRSRSELVTLLRNTPALERRRFHAISSGHSTSGVARPVPNEFAIWLDRAEWQPDPQGADWYETPIFADGTRPYWVPACRTVREVNLELDQRSLALGNLGSYDVQSIYGAIATGTHGSGMASGPLANFVLSIDLTTVVRESGRPLVRSFRIEPTQGITDRARFEEDVMDVELVQDDAVFFASVVSLGCLGVVTGLTLRVRPRFWLEERREVVPWSQFKRDVANGHRANPADRVYADLVLTALPTKRVGQPADHYVQLTTRQIVAAPAGGQAPDRDDARTKSAKAKFNAHGHSAYETALALSAMGSHAPRFGNACTLDRLVEDTHETFVSKSFKVFRSSVGDWIAATSAEIGVKKDLWMDATDALIAELRKLDGEGLHPISPIGIRFQQPSPHLFTQQHARATATFETPIPIGAFRKNGKGESSAADVAEMLGRLEAVLVAAPFEGRPHFGQRSSLSPQALRAAYGEASFDAFKANRATLDPYGIFGNEMTQRLGL